MGAVRRRQRVEDELFELQTRRMEGRWAAGIAKKRNPDIVTPIVRLENKALFNAGYSGLSGGSVLHGKTGRLPPPHAAGCSFDLTVDIPHPPPTAA